jgi:divalent metal cation (Fe/Co/Zn/Cd) transporter
LANNPAVAVTKFSAAIMMGSSTLLTQGIYSLVDMGNQGLLLNDIARSKRPADQVHPFGYGRELYFFSVRPQAL